MALQGVKRVYNDGRVDYAVVISNGPADYIYLNDEDNNYKQEFCDIEEVVRNQYQGCAWLTNTDV